MGAIYLIPNGPMPTSAGFVKVATGTSLKTMLQVKPGATQSLRVISWGISFDGFAAALPVLVELIEVDVAATITAHVAAGIIKSNAQALGAGDPTTSKFTLTTTGTGYTASGEGSVTASRLLSPPLLLPPTGVYQIQIPLAREAIIQKAMFGRIRVTAGTDVNVTCWMEVEA